jgi:hypothetical protein
MEGLRGWRRLSPGVIFKNFHRRHLDESQRAMVAAKIANMRQGARTDISPIGEKSQAEAAELLNVGKRSVERAREVLDEGIPELAEAVDRGDVSVSAAAEVARLSEHEQQEIVDAGQWRSSKPPAPFAGMAWNNSGFALQCQNLRAILNGTRRLNT